MLKRNISILAVIGVFAALGATSAAAKDDDVERAGTCTGNSSAEIDLSHEDGRIETEFEVDQNRSGVTWNVVIKRNGKVAARTRATTRGRSGSFEVRRLLGNGPGKDVVFARAKSPSGEVCTARASI